uniref:SFI1 centrin binding protein n=1 Tax=Amphiprion percula TaxID=161767 RepID=A0A3P8T2A6_AMPPE
MQSNARSSDSLRPRPSSITSVGETKRVRKVPTRKVPYRVGYSWNKGGRLKELRIRHLARKFLKIWIRNTFGRILPHEAKLYYNSVVLRRAFEGWRDEWWASRREWSLTLRAECHYRSYYLYNWTVNSWRKFISLQREKKAKVQHAQAFGMILTHRMRVLLAFKPHAWLKWKEMHSAARHQKDKESKAALHFNRTLKRRTLTEWINYISCCQTKKTKQGQYELSVWLHVPIPEFLSAFSRVKLHLFLTVVFVCVFLSCGSASLLFPPFAKVLE